MGVACPRQGWVARGNDMKEGKRKSASPATGAGETNPALV